MPRDVRLAAHAGAAFALVGALMLIALSTTVRSFTPSTATRVAALGVACSLLVQGVVLLRHAARLPGVFWVSVPTQVVVIVAFLGVATHDASAAATAFFIWPVLYAGYELRPWAAYLVLGQVVVGEAVVAFSVLSLDRAANDLICVGLSLGVVCALLVRAREGQARVFAELEHQAALDPLTGLATRRVLNAAATAALRAPKDDVTTLALVDVDHFKAVNDRLGHPAGDDALVHVAAHLRRQFPAPAVVARLGGDELAVLLPAVTPPQAAEQAESFRRRLAAEPLRVLDQQVPLTVSVGIAAGQHCAVEDLYAAADRALYQAKRAGRDRVVVDPPAPLRQPAPADADIGRTYRFDQQVRGRSRRPPQQPGRTGPRVAGTLHHDARLALPAEQAQVCAALSRAFLDDPAMSWVLPPGLRRREQRLRDLFALDVPRSAALCGAWTAAGGAGAALWYPPGHWRPSWRERLREVPPALHVLGGRLPVALRVTSLLEHGHPGEPHWYLAYLGVEPDRQGQGVGAALLQPVLEQCDRNRLGAFLEASTQRNRQLYERHGFAVTEPFTLPGGGPRLWRMWREPR